MKDVSAQGRTVLFVSHNMTSIKNLCARGVVLSDGQIDFNGEVNEAVQRYLSNNKIDSLSPRYALLDELNSGCYVTNVTPINDQFEFVEDIRFKVGLKYNLELNNTFFGFIIEDKHSNVIIASSTDETDINVLRQIEVGQMEIEVIVPRGILKPGTYSFSFSLRDTGGQVFHKVLEAFSFNITDTKTYRGIRGRYRKNAIVAPEIKYS